MMKRSIYLYFASALCVALLQLIPDILSVHAKKTQQLVASEQNVSLTNSSAVTQTPVPMDLSPINTPEPSNQSRPTPTPVLIPPPSDPRTTQLMVLFGILIVTIVIFGIWINRRKIF